MRLSFVSRRIFYYPENVPMALHASPDMLSGLAPLLRVRPDLQYLCRFAAEEGPEASHTGGLIA